MADECRTVTAPQLARMLGVSPQQVYHLARLEGQVAGIPAITLGRRVVFSLEQVDRVLRGETARAS